MDTCIDRQIRLRSWEKSISLAIKVMLACPYSVWHLICLFLTDYIYEGEAGHISVGRRGGRGKVGMFLLCMSLCPLLLYIYMYAIQYVQHSHVYSIVMLDNSIAKLEIYYELIAEW